MRGAGEFDDRKIVTNSDRQLRSHKLGVGGYDGSTEDAGIALVG